MRHAQRRRLALLALLVAGLVALWPAPAHAAEDAVSLSWTTDLTTDGLRPGGASTGELRLASTGPAPVEAVLGVRDVVDDEGSCLPQERRSALEDCGTGGLGTGELGDQLLLHVTRPDGTTVYEGPLRGLGDARSPGVVVPAGGETTLGVTLALPATSTNETMTDRVSFALVAGAGTTSGSVLAASVGAGGEQGGGQSDEAPPWFAGLPATGAGVGLALLLGALGLLGVGAALWRRGARHPR